MSLLFPDDEFVKLKQQLVLYQCALQNMQMRIDSLLLDFTYIQAYNPIEHIKNRLKSPESIVEKLVRRGFALTTENAMRELTDIAGIRIICSYARDIATLADVIKRQPDIAVIHEKDYIKNPKPSGYRSFHMIVQLPVHLTQGSYELPVEVQIRTQAMDFWASLEHKVRYKYNDAMPKSITQALFDCAKKIDELDKRMYEIQEVANLLY